MEDGVFTVQGFRAGAVAAGLKKDGGQDLALIYSECEASAAGVFTTNRVQAAPVLVTRDHLTAGRARAVVANAGNANACNGETGLEDARATALLAAGLLGVPKEQVLVASTGVIGLPLDMGRIEHAMPRLAETLCPEGFSAAASAIMTTDSFPKLAAAEGRAGGRPYRILGMAKGAGMIMPDMATMLCFVVTDLRMPPGPLQAALRKGVGRTFNRITVDGDTSTNDMVLVLANGKAGGGDPTAAEIDEFAGRLEEVMGALARMIVEDGEGATKVVDVIVRGARSPEEALTAARCVANSSLVKTAFFGQDPNWGRIMAALGRAGIGMDPDRVDIRIDGIRIVEGGKGLGRETETEAARVMAGKSFSVAIDLHQGNCGERVLTCDLTHDYVSINANYRT